MSDTESGVPDKPFDGFELPEYAQQAGLEPADRSDFKFIKRYENDDITIEMYWVPYKNNHYLVKLFDGTGTDTDHLEDARTDSIGGLQQAVEYHLRMLPVHRNPDQPASETFDTAGEWTA